MRLLTVGYALPHQDIDNYNALTAPSYFDYDAILVDPAAITRIAATLLDEGSAIEANDGRPVVNAPSTASAVAAAELLRRRLEETQRLLEMGGTVIVFGRPNAVQAGIVGFEGCDRYSWLPAPAGMAWAPPYLRAAEGKTVRLVAEDHSFAPFLRNYRNEFAYRAIFDDRQQAVRRAGRVVASGGSDVPIATEFAVSGGRVLFIPALKDESFTSRSEIAERFVDATRQLIEVRAPSDQPAWARSVAVVGLEQVEADLEEAEQVVMDAAARRDVVRERHDLLAAYRGLVTEEGRALKEAVGQALGLLGFGPYPGEAGAGLVVESEGQTAFVECEGAGEAVVEWPYVRLQRRLEKRLLEGSGEARGIIVVNGRRTMAPEDRTAAGQFTEALRIACENYRYALLTGETLFALVQRALAGANEAMLTGMRRRIMSTHGVVESPFALGDVEAKEDSGPIF